MRIYLLIMWLGCWIDPLQLHAQSEYLYSTIDSIKESKDVTIVIRRYAFQRSRPTTRTILLLHGGGPGAYASFGFGGRDINSFADDLTRKGFVVYLMDVRGWENSTAPAYNPNDTSLTAGSCQEAAADIDVVVDHIRKTEQIDKVNLFGWATGGHWVSYYTTLHNAKVDHLIVLNTLYGVKAFWTLSSAFADPVDSNRYNDRLGVYRTSTRKAIIDARLNSVPFPNKSDWIDTSSLQDYAKTVTGWVQNTLHVPGGYRKESFYMAHGYQYWNARDIHVSTLILRSEYDFWSRPIDAETFYNDLTNTPERKSIELKAATHFVFQDKPGKGHDQLLAAIDAFIPQPPPANISIDSLRTDDEVIDFIHRFDYTDDTLFTHPTGSLLFGEQNDRKWRSAFGAKTWEKGDFDGNGTTDLLFNGYINSDMESGGKMSRETSIVCLIILDMGRDSFRLIDMNPSHNYFGEVKKLMLDGHVDIGVAQLKKGYHYNWWKDSFPIRKDTLHYTFGEFIERRPPHPAHNIHELHFFTMTGLSLDPGYAIIIRDDSIKMKRPRSTIDTTTIWDQGGIFTAKLDTATAHRLYGLLNTIDITRLKTSYSVPWTDDSSGITDIFYDQHKSRRIDDYGQIGTWGLIAFYKLLDSLRKTQHLTKIASIDEYDFPDIFKW